MCLERTKKRSSYWSYVKEDSLIAEGFITTPLSQKKLQKNITQKSHAPRITWKGKGTRRKMREVGAWKNNSVRPVDALAVKKVNHSVTDNLKSRDASASKKVGNARCGQPKLKGDSFQVELPGGQRKHNYVKKCILHNLGRKRDNRLRRDREEKNKEEIMMGEDMARKMSRICFPTLDLEAKVCKT